jgi:biotin operon repressor
VIQSLTVAQLALELDRPGEARDALAESLANTRAIVTRSVEELEREGVPIQTLIRDVSPSSL